MSNEDKFTGKAEIYSKFRPSYPKELVDYLYTEAGFGEESAVADIGSGTGIFSRLLLEMGSRVYCVEPNADMRRLAERNLSGTDGYKRFTSIDATAENTGLRGGSVDFVTVAQAFHWFDPSAFHLECKRILKSGGKIALVWNVRDDNCGMAQRDSLMRMKYRGEANPIESNGSRKDNMRDFFKGRAYEEKVFRNDLNLSREAYIGMSLSRSYSPNEAEAPSLYYDMLKELNSIFDKYSANGVLEYPQLTEAYIGKP